MPFRTVDQEEGQTTIVNTNEITYLREDIYGTAIHFTSGDHIICPGELNTVLERLFGESAVRIGTMPHATPEPMESLLLRRD